MCLTIKKDEKLKTARKDKVVYKHVIEDYEGKLFTSYQSMEVEIGKTYTSVIRLQIHPFSSDFKDVHEALHSFKNIKVATEHAHDYGETLVECVIPKGSHYYEGKFFKNASYASDKLTYVRIIEHF